MGETFFIILDGTVGVKVPSAVEFEVKSYMEILNYIMQNETDIIELKDSHSHIVKRFIELLGNDFFK